MVRRLERLIEDVSFSGDIGPKEMGRTAARLEGLEEVIHDMHAFAKKVAPQEYLRRSPLSKTAPLKAGCDVGISKRSGTRQAFFPEGIASF